MRPAAAALALLLLAPPTGPAGADHVPTVLTMVALPDAGPGPGLLCFGPAKEAVQVADSCKMWCVTEYGCAIFLQDPGFNRWPFAVTYTDLQGDTVRRASNAEGIVCVVIWDMADYHFDVWPTAPPPGQVLQASATKDKGFWCHFWEDP